MPDHPTARVLRGDGDQDYAVLTLAGVTVTVYRALDATSKPQRRLVVDIDPDPDCTDELAVYANDAPVHLTPPPH